MYRRKNLLEGYGFRGSMTMMTGSMHTGKQACIGAVAEILPLSHKHKAERRSYMGM